MALFPVSVILLLSGVQATLWQNARGRAADQAQRVAALVATREVTPGQAAADLEQALGTDPDLRAVVVTAERGVLTTVAVSADVPGILIGTHTRITVRASLPTEGWRSLP